MDTIKDLKVNLEQKILQSNKVVIVPHNGVDFDAIGSAIGLTEIVKKLKKVPHIVVNDLEYKLDKGVQIILNEFKSKTSIINKEKYLEIKDPNDLFLLTDVNKEYLISLRNEIKSIDRNNIIIIDHHDVDQSTVDTDFKYIDTDISSASEIVTKLLQLFKVKISSNVANYLLAGIHLDTNRLKKNTSSDTFKTIARLLECGANNEIINKWFIEDFNSYTRVHSLVGKAEMMNFSIAIVKGEDANIYTKEELAKAADYLLNFGVDASFVIGDIGNNIISISARSNEKIDVGSVMKDMNGGGNRYSAATKITDMSEDEIYKKLVKIITPPCYVDKNIPKKS